VGQAAHRRRPLALRHCQKIGALATKVPRPAKYLRAARHRHNPVNLPVSIELLAVLVSVPATGGPQGAKKNFFFGADYLTSPISCGIIVQGCTHPQLTKTTGPRISKTTYLRREGAKEQVRRCVCTALFSWAARRSYANENVIVCNGRGACGIGWHSSGQYSCFAARLHHLAAGQQHDLPVNRYAMSGGQHVLSNHQYELPHYPDIVLYDNDGRCDRVPLRYHRGRGHDLPGDHHPVPSVYHQMPANRHPLHSQSCCRVDCL